MGFSRGSKLEEESQLARTRILAVIGVVASCLMNVSFECWDASLALASSSVFNALRISLIHTAFVS